MPNRRWTTVLTVTAVAVVLGGTVASAGASGRTAPVARTATHRAPLPSWAIGPFTRYAGNPIMTPPVNPTSKNNWRWPETFNPSVVVVHGVYHMLYRGAASGNFSSIGAATSRDGHHFKQAKNNPVIRRDLPTETHGVEDPRMYYHHGRYFAFFTGYDGTNIGLNEAVSKDARHWRQIGRIIPDTKNAAVIANPQGRPVKINGHYVMYYGQAGNGAHLATSTDLTHWKTTATVNPHFPKSYEPWELCVAVTNYPNSHGKISKNIVLFVAGQLMGRGRWFYAVSEIMFRRGHLTAPAAQLHHAVLRPQAPYEIYGYTPHTVFMNNILLHNGKWLMYYGAGDSVVALATAPVRRG